jgi:hypothetical protein
MTLEASLLKELARGPATVKEIAMRRGPTLKNECALKDAYGLD